MSLRTGSAIGMTAALTLSGLVWAAPASAITQNDLQMPFPCGEVWQGATRESHPSGTSSHYALDLNKGSGADDRGEDVVASAAGTVTKVGGSYGSVWINHGDGWSTRYLHMSGIRVKNGDWIKQGQVIGDVDGVAPSPVTPHLHYEQRYNGGLSHIRFNGSAIQYSFVYNGPSFTSHNCPTTPPAPVVLQAHHYTTNNNLESGTTQPFVLSTNQQEHFRGDWDGNGTETPGRRIGNRFVLSNVRDGVTTAHDFLYGNADDELVVGDWDGDGMDSIGLVRGNEWFLRNALSSGTHQITFTFGETTDEVVAGDWNGDGIDTPGLIRGIRWFLHNSNTSTSNPSTVLDFGRDDDVKFVGDWDGDGRDTPGVRRDITFHLRASNGPSSSSVAKAYGRSTDMPIVGDWDGDGYDTIGVIRFQ